MNNYCNRRQQGIIILRVICWLAIYIESSYQQKDWWDSGKFQGDINMSKQDFLRFMEEDNAYVNMQYNANTPQAVMRAAIRDKNKLWPNGVVPYRISNSYYPNEVKQIKDGMEEFHKHTCIRFVPRTTEKNYIHFKPLSGCYSFIGKNYAETPQDISLMKFGCFSLGTIVHEMMHALGFFHEQSRADRDEFVQIKFENINEKFKDNFEKYDLKRITHLETPYDYSSVMHYPDTAFTKNQKKTIIKLKGGSQILGQREGFSKWDIIRINRLYDCELPPTTTTTTSAPTTTTRGPPAPATTRGPPGTRKTTTTKTLTTPRPRPKPKPTNPCINRRDTNTFCQNWARQGECTKNPANMGEYCSLSCCKVGAKKPTKPTDSGCSHLQDSPRERFCDDWAKTKNQCAYNAVFMRQKCAHSCCLYKGIGKKSTGGGRPKPTPKPRPQPRPTPSRGGCGCLTNSNGSTQCNNWAKQGECITNAGNMLKFCQRACCERKQFDRGCAAKSDGNRSCGMWAKHKMCEMSHIQSQCSLSCCLNNKLPTGSAC